MKNPILFFTLPILLFTACELQPEKIECCKNSISTDSLSASINSLYQSGGNWDDQNNQSLILEKLKGKVQVIAMIFTHCEYACPRIVADIQAIETQIPLDKKSDVGFVLVTFDTERDTIQRLNEFYREMKLNENWLLLLGSEQQIRELSVLLNVQYEKQQDGNFSHSNVITILNKDGEINFQQDGLGADTKGSIEAINKLLRQ